MRPVKWISAQHDAFVYKHERALCCGGLAFETLLGVWAGQRVGNGVTRRLHIMRHDCHSIQSAAMVYSRKKYQHDDRGCSLTIVEATSSHARE